LFVSKGEVQPRVDIFPQRLYERQRQKVQVKAEPSLEIEKAVDVKVRWHINRFTFWACDTGYIQFYGKR
jgi:hypothetical protein